MTEYNQYGGTYHHYLRGIADSDVSEVLRKEATYKGSWKKRGGVGAYMMLARKWDRIESMLETNPKQYDLFDMTIGMPQGQGEDGTMLAEIRDLRRYLALVEAWFLFKTAVPTTTVVAPLFESPRKAPTGPGTPEDGGHHARQDG